MAPRKGRKRKPSEDLPTGSKKRRPHSRSSSPPAEAPKPPENAVLINTENNLHLLPPDRVDFDRPWFLYDWVDPASKFRQVRDDDDDDEDQYYLSMGDDSDQLTDNYYEGTTRPVDVYGHVQKYVVTVAAHERDKPLFDYKENDMCTVCVQAVSWPRKLKRAARERRTPSKKYLKKAIEYKVHAGYRRVLMGFTREIEYLTTDKLKAHNSLFRATYLIKVLDYLAEELQENAATLASENGSRFRSRVLNPILQRQRLGLPDHEPGMVEFQVGTTAEAAAISYLTSDPLDLELRGSLELLRGLLYAWPTRTGFRRERMSEEEYEETMNNTKRLLDAPVKLEGTLPESALTSDEVEVITAENLTHIYGHLLPALVSRSIRRRPLAMLTGQFLSPKVEIDVKAVPPNDGGDPQDVADTSSAGALKSE